MQVTRSGRPKSQEKREAILEAAKILFLENGVKETSMEEIAKKSRVSKQTVYSHYQNKDALFSAVIAFKCKEYLVTTEQLLHDDKACLETALVTIASKFFALIFDEAVISVYKTIIAEGNNSPRVAELFYEAGPLASINALCDALHYLAKGNLTRSDARELSIDFYSLLKSDFHTRSLMNLDFKLNEAEKEAFIRTVVQKTLCLYEHYYNKHN
ncbi:TetR/AcrR family transcriptional regulator [Ningiella sp. W23]|uniref:TetR/AcrR family transcriptional regulator n=1 Tax=Ningiella sp. W23 TaxID=3023715 RepID=UPI003756D13D